MDHAEFWAKVGKLLSVETRAEGTTPTRTWIVKFTHANGWAEYDGKAWRFHLNP